MTTVPLTRKKLWDFDGWSLWQWKIQNHKPLFTPEHSLFHNCCDGPDHKVNKNAHGEFYCHGCWKEAPESTIAVLELMNWEGHL